MILIHVSDVKVGTLVPGPDGVVYLSEGCFISHFGKYVYLFDKDSLMRSGLPIVEAYSDGLYAQLESHTRDWSVSFKSKPLGKEFQVASRIDVKRYALGVVEHWNHLDGQVTHELMGVVNMFEMEELRRRM